MKVMKWHLGDKDLIVKMSQQEAVVQRSTFPFPFVQQLRIHYLLILFMSFLRGNGSSLSIPLEAGILFIYERSMALLVLGFSFLFISGS